MKDLDILKIFYQIAFNVVAKMLIFVDETGCTKRNAKQAQMIVMGGLKLKYMKQDQLIWLDS